MRETVLGQRFIFHRLNSLPRPPIRTEIVSGFAAAGEMIALVGPPGTGKSAIGVLLASSVAAGTPFLGRTVRRGTVVYVAAERRIEAERRLLAGGDSELPIYVSGARPALANADDVDDLINGLAAIESAAESPIRLVIFDTAAKCFRGLDENSARDVGMAVEGLTRIGEAVPTAVIALLHHTDKSGHSMRGSSALLGAVDLEATIKNGGANHRLEVTKANAVAEGQVLPFRLVPVRIADGQEVIAAQPAAETQPIAANDVGIAIRLPRDTFTALKCLNGMGGVGSIETWRNHVYIAFGDRTGAAKRVAFNSAKKRLVDTNHIVISGDTVSVSEA